MFLFPLTSLLFVVRDNAHPPHPQKDAHTLMIPGTQTSQETDPPLELPERTTVCHVFILVL